MLYGAEYVHAAIRGVRKMKKIPLTRRHLDMLEKAIRWTIADLQYEQHEAQKHGCTGEAYTAEINEYRELKSHISNENI